jgi:hypothetical protein
MAGAVHGVAGYAPAGYRLERTDYEGGSARHLFVAYGKPELVCVVGAHEDERVVLLRFQDECAVRARFEAPAPDPLRNLRESLEERPDSMPAVVAPAPGKRSKR